MKADALTQRGIKVTLVGRPETVLPTVDPSLGKLVEEQLRHHVVTIASGVTVQAIKREGSCLSV